MLWRLSRLCGWAILIPICLSLRCHDAKPEADTGAVVRRERSAFGGFLPPCGSAAAQATYGEQVLQMEDMMFNAKSLLDNLTTSLGLGGGVGTGTGASGGIAGAASGLGSKAKALWDGQSTLGKGAIAGGLLGVLFTDGGRKLLGTGASVGVTALIGGLAYKAWQDWQSGSSPEAAVAAAPAALPSVQGTAFLPNDQASADDLAQRILQAMVGAAKADGHVTPDERARIDATLPQLGLGAEAEALIRAELDAPLDVRRIAGLARSPEEAAEIYTASLLVVDEQSLEEKGYLAMLAAALNLDPGLVDHVHARAADLTKA